MTWNQRNAWTHADIYTKGLVDPSVKVGLNKYEDKSSIVTLPIGVGLQAVLSRHVTPNSGIINTGTENHLYEVKDKVKLRFALDSPLLRKIIKKIGFLSLDAYIRFYEKEYVMITHSDSVKDGYLRPFYFIKQFLL